MRPITVSVGPLAASYNIANNQAVGTVGLLNTNQVPPGGSNTGVCNANVTAAGAVLTQNSGVMVPGVTINGLGVKPGTVVIGPGPTPGTWTIQPPQTFTARTVRGNIRVVLDAPRQIQITNTEPAGTNSFLVTGYDAQGTPISETLLSTGAAVTTSQNFAVVTGVSCANPLAALASVQAAAATTPWVHFDPYVRIASISKQCVVNGVATYSVQVSNDHPSALLGITPGSMVWSPDPDATFVGANASRSGNWPFIPLWARVLLSAGAGSVTATFVQQDGG